MVPFAVVIILSIWAERLTRSFEMFRTPSDPNKQSIPAVHLTYSISPSHVQTHVASALVIAVRGQ